MNTKTTLIRKSFFVLTLFFNLFITFTIFASAQNPPTPADDSYSGIAARSQSAPGFLANDSDPDGDTLRVGGVPGFPSIVTLPTNGKLTITYLDGSFSYQPDPGFTGNDSFVYNACDSTTCTPATVTLISANSAPIGNTDTYSGVEARSQLKPGILENDSDPDGDPLTVGAPLTPRIVRNPDHGSLLIQYSDGSFIYTPEPGYTGDDSFEYNSCDNFRTCTATTVNLIKPNSAPVGNPDFFETKSGEGLGINETSGENLITLNDSDPDGDPIRLGGLGVQTLITLPKHGNLNVPYTDGTFTYSPDPGFTGLDYFVYNLCDSLRACTPEFVYIFVTAGDAENAGRSCPAVGQPVNVSNGNMWVEHTDYGLPGVGQNIQINRFYNTIVQKAGLFGFGWSTAYDESLTIFDSKAITLNMPDGRAINFGRTDDTDPYNNLTPDFYGELVKNPDDTYTLTFKEGVVHHFRSDGKLLWQRDIDGNQTTLNYDTSGSLTGITDSLGRTLNVTMINGRVAQISDSIGIVADYVYNPDDTLLSVTYADNSKYQFEYTTGGGKILLTTVKDALNNVLETHQYDSQGRALTSEKDGGVEKYTFDYTNAELTADPFTIVTDALGRTTKYTFDKSKGRNVVTKIEGNCSSCGSGGTETTSYEYDDKLNLTKETDALNNQITYTY